MTRIEHEATRIHIAAPDGPAAFALERRLSHLRPVTIGVEGDWTVELVDDDERLEEIEAAVRHWLTERGLGATTITVDGLPHPITAGEVR